MIAVLSTPESMTAEQYDGLVEQFEDAREPALRPAIDSTSALVTVIT